MRSLVVILLLVLHEAAADCSCGKNNQTVSVSNPVIIFNGPTEGGTATGAKCSMNCEYDAYVDEGSGFKFSLVSSSFAKSTLVIYDGDVVVFTLPRDLDDVKNYVSGNNHVHLSFTEEQDGQDSFMLVLTKSDPGSKPAVTTTPSTATTTEYVGPLGPGFNPAFISDDVVVIVDIDGDAGKVQQLKDFAEAVVAQLPLGDGKASNSRVALCSVSAVYPAIPNAVPFTLTNDAFRAAVQGLQALGDDIGYADFKTIKKLLTDSIFTTDNTRPHTQRVVFIFTAKGTDGAAETVLTNLLPADVYGVVVTTETTDSDNKNFKPFTDVGLKVFTLTTDDDAGLKTFVNKYLQSADQYSCQVTGNDLTVTVIVPEAEEDPKDFSIPPKYDGQKSTSTAPWSNDIHYCNFQETTITVKLGTDSHATSICYEVYYELEADRDFVKIHDENGVLYVSLSGIDVSGTTFCIPVKDKKQNTVYFKSDYQGIYDGFYAKVTEGPAATPQS